MPRKVVVATDLAADSERALDWALENVYKTGDVFHIVHVAKLKDETSETFHGAVGTSFHYHEKTPEQTNAMLEERKQYIATKHEKCRINSPLDAANVPHETHLFLEGENAAGSEVAALVKKVYEEVGGDLLVASRSNKAMGRKKIITQVAVADHGMGNWGKK